MNFKIVDSHVHFEVAGTEISGVRQKYIEKHSKEKWDLMQQKNQYVKDNWSRAWQFPKPLPPSEDVNVTANMWLEEMDKNNIEKMVFVTGGDNETLGKIVKLAPERFVGYAHHDPCTPDAAEKLEYAITTLGLKGYKMFAPLIDVPFTDPSLEPVWKVAEKYRIPILIHFGILGSAGGISNHININPIVLHDVARAYPEVPFIVPHLGCGHPRDLLYLAWVCPNVYVDTSGSNQWVNWMPYPLTVKDLLKKFYQTIGPKRILFGTDSMWFPRGFVTKYFDEQMRACVELGMSANDIDCIFRTNMLDLLEV